MSARAVRPVFVPVIAGLATTSGCGTGDGSAFSADVDALLDRRRSHAPPDSVVNRRDDGC